MGQESEFENWISKQLKWLQTAAAILANNKAYPNAKEIENLVDLCCSEVAGNSAGFETMPVGIFAPPINDVSLKLLRIEKPVGINALDEKSNLDFEKSDLVIVFGSSASGKSGYSRLLKHACGTRRKQELLHNVYSTRPKQLQSALFTIIKQDNEYTLEWNSDKGSLRDLQHIHVFDTVTAQHYVSEEIEASYEPRRMRFISALVKISDQIKEIIKRRKATLIKAIPVIPVEFDDAELGRWFFGLSHKTSLSEVESNSIFSEQEDSLRLSLEEALKQKDPKKALLDTQQKLNLVEKFREDLQKLNLSISDQNVAKILNTREEAINKRRFTTEQAEKIFKNGNLPDVGKNIWQTMWNAARQYSEHAAYLGHAFPHTEDGARCVLCQQTLDINARQRMQDFENFIRGELEKQAAMAEKKYDELLSEIPVLPELQSWCERLFLINFDNKEAEKIWHQLNSEISALKDKNKPQIISNSDLVLLMNLVSDVVKKMQIELVLLKKLSEESGHETFKKQLNSLKAKEWVAKQKESILIEIQRLKQVEQLEKAERSTNTKVLTQKKNELAEQEIAGGYRERFTKELKRLGGNRIRVELKTLSPGKGKINFALQLKGAQISISVHDVLSEGENRIVALASFLADVVASSTGMPFIFDDPITSLDQDFEERVVERLIDLSKERQVIIFTHRLSFLTLLDEAVSKSKAMLVKPEIKLKKIFLRQFGEMVGIVTDARIHESKIPQALNALMSRLEQAEKLVSAVDYDGYNHSKKAICSDFRIVVERVVEEVLLDGIVRRFRRKIITQNKLTSLSRIQLNDCQLVDRLMSAYSPFEHSQSEEISVELDIETIKSDILILQKWIKEFNK